MNIENSINSDNILLKSDVIEINNNNVEDSVSNADVEQTVDNILELPATNTTQIEPEPLVASNESTTTIVENIESTEELIQLEEQLRKMSAERILLLEQRKSLIENSSTVNTSKIEELEITQDVEEIKAIEEEEEEETAKAIKQNDIEHNVIDTISNDILLDSNLNTELDSLIDDNNVSDDVVDNNSHDTSSVVITDASNQNDINIEDARVVSIEEEEKEEENIETKEEVEKEEEEEQEILTTEIGTSESFTLSTNRYYLKFINSKTITSKEEFKTNEIITSSSAAASSSTTTSIGSSSTLASVRTIISSQEKEVINNNHHF